MTISGNILLPTAYFPPISYLVHLLRHKTIYIEQMETFPKQTYRNRCEIMTAAGKAKLIIPVTKPQGNHTLTRNIEICYREPWREQHWKTIQSAYSSSPFFSFYADIFKPLFESRETLLIRHNLAIFETISGLLGIDPSVEFRKDYIKEPDDTIDLRTNFSPGRTSPVGDFPAYPQVFEHKHGFMRNLSVLDLLFNLGPDAGKYLQNLL